MKTNKSFLATLILLACLVSLGFVSAQAQTLWPVQINGEITAYTPSSCGSAGSITIAGVTLNAPPGVDITFGANNRTVVTGAGISTTGLARAEAYELIGTRRTLNAYVDDGNNIRFAPKLNFVSGATGTNVFAISLGTTTSTSFTITGRINSVNANAISINGMTFPIAPGAAITAAAVPQVVVVTGVFNNTGQLTRVVASANAYRRVTISGIPQAYAGGMGSSSYVTQAGETICDNFEGGINYGFTTLFLAPDFQLGPNTSALYLGVDAVVDQFGYATAGTKFINQNETSVCGIAEAFTAPPVVSEPTALTEAQQRGRLVIGGLAMTIGPNEKVTNQEVIRVGQSYCIYPIYNNYAEAPPGITPGQLGLTRAFQLMTGSRIVPQ